MIQLPSAIWLEVASYLPSRDLELLYSVNRTFFRLAMDIRYGTIDLTYISAHTVTLLSRLKNGYAVAFVHSVNLSSNVLQSLISQEDHDLRFERSLHGRLVRFKNCILRRTQVTRTRLWNRIETSRCSSDVALDIIEVLSNLPNVKQFSATYNHMKEVSYHPDLSFIWPSIGAGLQALNLSGLAAKLPLMLQHAPSLTLLQDLSVTLLAPPNSYPLCLQAEQEILHCLASFVNRHQGHLKSLTIRIWWHGDLSDLFTKLGLFNASHSSSLMLKCCTGVFPLLENLCLQIHLDEKRISEISGLLSFLRANSASIKGFTLRCMCCTHCSVHRSHLHKWEDKDSWVNQILQLRLPNLMSLDLSLRSDRHRPVELGLGFAAVSLQSFRLESSHLSLLDLKLLTSYFPSNTALRHLHLNVLTIEKATFDILSRSFPLLRTLSLVAAPISVQPTQASLADQLTREFNTSGALYANWPLRDLVLATASCCHTEVNWAAMKVAALYIPSLESFHGHRDLFY